MTWTEPAFEAVAGLLRMRTGMAIDPDRRPGAELGIRRAMARAGIRDAGPYRERLTRDDALFDDLVGELAIGETYFFREPGQFRFLRQSILPEFRRRFGSERVLHAWSAGCASGEEAYSLAMVFAEEGFAARSTLLATDISTAALEKARRATYRSWSLRGEGASAALPHLEHHGDQYVVKEPIRRKVVLGYLNLALDIYPSLVTGLAGFDLIFCRNVLIYFDRETVRSVAHRLFTVLAAGGWLITASSDPPLGDKAPLQTLVSDQGVFYRKECAAEDRVVASEGAPAATEPPRDRDPVEAPPLSVAGALSAARADLASGAYAAAAARMQAWPGLAEAAVLRVRALANLDPEEAEHACARAVALHPTSIELNHLWAVLLHGLGRDGEAARTVRRVLYLDRSLAIAHFLLGSILRRQGNRLGAWRSFRNARDLCTARPGDEIVALSDGEPAGRLAEAAALQMARLENRSGEGLP
jgi:chemotaxis protein methyltransferase CheR